MLTPEIAWAAGIFEGEGCIWTKNGGICISVSMTDEDTVRRWAAAVGKERIYDTQSPSHIQRGHKRCYTVTVSGHDAVDILTMMWDGLGARRQNRTREILPTVKFRRPRRYKGD